MRASIIIEAANNKGTYQPARCEAAYLDVALMVLYLKKMLYTVGSGMLFGVQLLCRSNLERAARVLYVRTN